jgi:tRNA G18 (ribose-2'-O)-methylase SpoU
MNTNSVAFFKQTNIPDSDKNHELIIAVWELKNPGNVGHIIRLAHNIGASCVLFINENTFFRESKIKKTAGFSFDQMNWKFITKNDFFLLIENGIVPVLLETCAGATNLFSTELPDRMLLIAGNESFGIPVELLEKCPQKVFIPMPGSCKSMNVSHAISVASFEWYRQKTINLFR